MKRLIAAILIFGFIVTICISCNLYVKKKCEETIENLENCYLSLSKNDNSYAYKEAKAIRENWEKDKDRLELFLNHEFLDNISVCISQLPVLAQSSSIVQFALTAENIECLLNEIKHEQRLSLHSFY